MRKDLAIPEMTIKELYWSLRLLNKGSNTCARKIRALRAEIDANTDRICAITAELAKRAES